MRKNDLKHVQLHIVKYEAVHYIGRRNLSTTSAGRSNCNEWFRQSAEQETRSKDDLVRLSSLSWTNPSRIFPLIFCCCCVYIEGRFGIELFHRATQSESTLYSSRPSARTNALRRRRPRLIDARRRQVTFFVVVGQHRVALCRLDECKVVEPLRRAPPEPATPNSGDTCRRTGSQGHRIRTN